jgi:hypothetical protein
VTKGQVITDIQTQNHQLLREHSPPKYLLTTYIFTFKNFETMKKLCIYLLLLFVAINSFAQINDGSRILTSTVSVLYLGFSKGESSSSINPTLTSKTSGLGFTTEVTYGKIKKNYLFSYGLQFTLGFDKNSNNSSSAPSNQKNHRIEFAPVLSYQKFYSLTDKLYFSPFSRLSVGYQYSKQGATSSSSASIQKGLAGSLAFHPFSLTFSKNPKTNFLFTIGTVSIDYTRTKSYYQPVLYDSKTISTTFLLNAQIGGIGFGIQKLF